MRSCINIISSFMVAFYGLSLISDSVEMLVSKSYVLYSGMVIIFILNFISMFKDNKND